MTWEPIRTHTRPLESHPSDSRSTRPTQSPFRALGTQQHISHLQHTTILACVMWLLQEWILGRGTSAAGSTHQLLTCPMRGAEYMPRNPFLDQWVCVQHRQLHRKHASAKGRSLLHWNQCGQQMLPAQRDEGCVRQSFDKSHHPVSVPWQPTRWTCWRQHPLLQRLKQRVHAAPLAV